MSLPNQEDISGYQSKIDELRAKEREQLKRRLIFQFLVGALLTLTGAIFVTGQFIKIVASKPPQTEIGIPNREVSALKSEIDRLKTELSLIRSEITKIEKPNAAGIAIEQKKLNTLTEKLDQRLNSIESIIIDSPEKSLAIPLLRKDIEINSKRLEEYRLLERAEIDRLYSQLTWILGLISSALIAATGGAITLIIRLISKSKTDAESKWLLT